MAKRKQKLGRPPVDSPRTEIVRLRVSQEERDRLTKFANDHDKNTSEVLRDGLREAGVDLDE